MKMINVLNKLTELSKENTSPDVKQALESTRKINGDANLQVIEEHIVEGRIDDLNDRRAAKKHKSKKHKDEVGTKEKPRKVKGHRYGGSKQKDDDDREDLDEAVLQTEPQWDRRATLAYGEKIKQALERATSANVEEMWNKDGSLTLVVNPRVDDRTRGYGTGQTGPGASVENISAAINPFFRMFRQKGWRFDQPREGRVTFAVPAEQGVAESDELARRADLRAKSGEGILTKRKYGPEYKAHMRNKKNLKQDPYEIAGPKGALPEGKLNEKWGTETKVSPSEKGKYAGKTKAELLKSYNALKKTGPHKKGSKEYGRMRELSFAIRAKGGWGKVQEVITKKTSAGEIISDFQKSEDPRFKGKSKAQRKKQALGAYYGMHPEKSKVKETAMTPKQKKFAALAQPKDKITYADKIAGARKNTGVKETKLTPKQMKIAKAAKPNNAITGADFAALRTGRKVASALVREGAERKAKNLTESKMITETNDLVDLRKLAGLNECGMMGTTMGAHTPANISINASAASGSEVASMMRDLMRLAGGETAAPMPQIAVMDGAACGGMEEMVDESEQDGHFADATTEPAEQVFDENPVVSMTGKQVQTPNGNARQNDNPLEESLWKKYQVHVNEGFDPESFEGSTDVTWIGDDGEEVEGYVNYIATPDPQTGRLNVKLTGGDVTGNNIAAKVDDHMIQYLITDPDYSPEYQQAAEQDAQAQWDSRDAKQHDLGNPAAM
jgi:hypothetical protein